MTRHGGQPRDRFPDHSPLLAAMTAYGDYAHPERAADAGFDLQFTKPAAPAEVIEQMRQNPRDGALLAPTGAEGRELTGSPSCTGC